MHTSISKATNIGHFNLLLSMLNVVVDVLSTVEKVLSEVLDQKISEAQFLIPDNYGMCFCCLTYTVND